MEVAMQLNPSSTVADRSFPLMSGHSRARPAIAAQSTLADPSAIFRRLDRTAVAIAVLAVAAAGGVIAVQDQLAPFAAAIAPWG
jgi:hypothetical protein